MPELIDVFHYSNRDIDILVSVNPDIDMYRFRITYPDVPGTEVFWLNRMAVQSLVIRLGEDLENRMGYAGVGNA